MVRGPTFSDFRPAPSGAVRIGAILGLPGMLARFGVDPAAVFAEAAVDPLLLRDERGFIALADLDRLFAASVSATGCPHVGLLVAQGCGIARMGLVGQLALEEVTLGAALADFTRYPAAFNQAAVSRIAVDGDVAVFSLTLVEPDFATAAQVLEGGLAIMAQLVRDLCGQAWAPDAVMFAHRSRGPLQPYRKHFRAPVRFGAEMTAIVFPARILEQAIVNPNRTGHGAELRKIAAGAERDEPIALRVRRQITVPISQDRAAEPAVASALGMDTRTLRRRLAREGANFRGILQVVRYQYARRLMRESNMGLAEVGAALGYAEPSVFTRAFRRWSGVSPSRWRQGAAN